MMQQQNLPNMSETLEFVENYLLTHDDYLEEQRKEIKHNFSRFKSELKGRWIKAHKIEDSFIAKNSAWLEETFTIPTVVQRPGRPKKMFGKASDRTKRRTTQALRSAVDVEVLTHAAQVKLRSWRENRCFPSPERHHYVTEAGHQIKKCIRYASAGRKNRNKDDASKRTGHVCRSRSI